MRAATAFVALLIAASLSACPGNTTDLDRALPDSGDDPPPDAAVDVASDAAARRVTVVNWNVENFFNDQIDSPELGGACAPNQTTPCEEVVSAAAFAQKLEALRAVLAPLDADVLVLSETENLATASALAEALGGYPHRYVPRGNDPRGIDVAVLSKIPFSRTVTHADEFFGGSASPGETYKFARDCVEVGLELGGPQLSLLGVHFKAAQDQDSQNKRIAEAEQVRRIATGIAVGSSNAGVVVLGDFNALPTEPPITTLLATGDGYESVVALVPEADRYTFGDPPTARWIDDQLRGARARAWLDASSARVLHGAAVRAASDHSPVVATYEAR